MAKLQMWSCPTSVCQFLRRDQKLATPHRMSRCFDFLRNSDFLLPCYLGYLSFLLVQLSLQRVQIQSQATHQQSSIQTQSLSCCVSSRQAQNEVPYHLKSHSILHLQVLMRLDCTLRSQPHSPIDLGLEHAFPIALHYSCLLVTLNLSSLEKS